MRRRKMVSKCRRHSPSEPASVSTAKAGRMSAAFAAVAVICRTVGQTIVLRRPLRRAFGPRNFVKKMRAWEALPDLRFFRVSCFQGLRVVFRPCRPAAIGRMSHLVSPRNVRRLAGHSVVGHGHALLKSECEPTCGTSPNPQIPAFHLRRLLFT